MTNSRRLSPVTATTDGKHLECFLRQHFKYLAVVDKVISDLTEAGEAVTNTWALGGFDAWVPFTWAQPMSRPGSVLTCMVEGVARFAGLAPPLCVPYVV